MFLEVDVEPGPAAPDGLTLRFKRADLEASGAPTPIVAVDWESDEGLAGTWRIEATDDEAGEVRSPAMTAHVEDSSDGVVHLVLGGRHGLRLEHPTGVVAREPYLVLTLRAVLHRP